MTKEIRRLRELAGLNRSDKFVLNELFDNPYSYEWILRSDRGWKAKFKNVDGHVIDVDFQILYESSVDVRFERNNKAYITGQKDQFRIFATVLTIIKDFMENNNDVNHLCFTADEKSQVSLYRRMLSRFANENGFDFEEEKFRDYSKFYLSIVD